MDISDDDLTITAAGEAISGWETIEVTLSAESFPNSFAISMSSPENKLPAAGAACTVSLGKDIVVTGYVDRIIEHEDARSHTVAVTGRGKTQDLVDCSAEWPSGQILSGTALTIAQKLAAPYADLSVKLGDGADAGPTLPGWLLNFGETGSSIIRALARNAKLLAYENSAGVLVLATAGTKKMASGIAYGSNVEEWTYEQSADARFSDYVCSYFPSNTALALTGPGSIFYHREKDPAVKRHRQLDFVMEKVATDKEPGEFTIGRARWEASRRAGRSTVLTAIVDSWRDSAGKLWEPNALASIDLPGVQKADLLISEVTFRRSSERGTTAALTLMPASAFAPEPLVLQPVSAALTKGNS